MWHSRFQKLEESEDALTKKLAQKLGRDVSKAQEEIGNLALELGLDKEDKNGKWTDQIVSRLRPLEKKTKKNVLLSQATHMVEKPCLKKGITCFCSIELSSYIKRLYLLYDKEIFFGIWNVT